MRIRIVQRPTLTSIDGLQLDRFEPGYQYEVGNSLGALLLAEGWAEPVPFDEPALLVPLAETAPLSPPDERPPAPFDPENPPNLLREVYPPYLDRLPDALAADFDRRRTARPPRVTPFRRRSTD